MPVCSKCGKMFRSFCPYCQVEQDQTAALEMMEVLDMDVTNLLLKLREHVHDKNNFPALALAINMKRIGPVKQVEHSGQVKVGLGDLLREIGMEEEVDGAGGRKSPTPPVEE